MQEELRRRGFVLDGIEPLGTRVTSTRLTANLNLSREVVPFVRLRFDVRHTESAVGLEALGGVKLRPGKFFVLAQGGWRQYFAAQVLTVCADGGYEGDLAGAQLGGSALRRTSLTGADGRFVFEVHAMGWADVSLLIPSAKGVMASLQYQGLLDSGFLYHMGFVQLGYRF